MAYSSIVGVCGRVVLTLPRYLFVALLGFSIGTGVLWSLIEFAGFPTVAAGATAGMLSIVHDFTWHERWTFASARHGSIAPRFLRFFLSKAGGYFVALGTLVALVEGVGLHYLLANIFAVGASFIWNYTLSITWIWRVRS